MKAIVAGLLGWGARSVVGRKKAQPAYNPAFETIIAIKLLQAAYALQKLEATEAMFAARQRALYSGQTLDDVLDPDWMSKPRKGLNL